MVVVVVMDLLVDEFDVLWVFVKVYDFLWYWECDVVFVVCYEINVYWNVDSVNVVF